MLEFAISLIPSSAPPGGKLRWSAGTKIDYVLEAPVRIEQTETVDSLPISIPFGDDPSVGPTSMSSIEFNPAVEDWTRASEKRFRELADVAALGSLSPAEAGEFKMIQSDRRRLHHPRPPEEVIWEYNRNQVTQNLLRALNDYVQLLGPAR